MDTITNAPDPLVIEMYKQAHENRRKYEGYVWQWGVLLTVLAALFVGLGVSPGQALGPADGLEMPQRVVISLVSLFVILIAVNVWRARQLMKSIERALADFHARYGHSLPTVPSELDVVYRRRVRVGSTLVALICHVAACAVFLYLTAYAWVG
jgi:hypothetical protein